LEHAHRRENDAEPLMRGVDLGPGEGRELVSADAEVDDREKNNLGPMGAGSAGPLRTRRRRNRTFQAVGCTALLALKATRFVPENVAVGTAVGTV